MASRVKPRRRTKTAIHSLLADSYPELGVIRCPDGDLATFNSGVEELLEVHDWAGYRVYPPVWEWFRINPIGMNNELHDEYVWLLGRPGRPGPGNWRGAIVRVADPDTSLNSKLNLLIKLHAEDPGKCSYRSFRQMLHMSTGQYVEWVPAAIRRRAADAGL